MRDENDIPFNEYSVDFFTFLNSLFERLFGGGSDGGIASGWSISDFISMLANIWSIIVVLSWLLAALFLFGLIYAYIRGEQVGEVIAAILKRQEETYDELYRQGAKNGRWHDILSHIESDRMNDWKLAIIEADILLEELLESIGLLGATVGDKLKNASPTSFRTVNQAWRAHNVRNRIAHEGSEFELSQREAQETIAQYKMVFEEFNAI
ncbi:hypothetical protein A2392_00360 [Candidatus Kaiserbacteria bacterium RIFOXYB1_FULL_46_14]|uniref:Uncharacterized protein n=1 Tax=Candidatus Kaiserbacteria bacterium RIFOXYB1_FULL_46_14 TaxID=1798531 RepID=A0A1F6FJ11_9BACT|nr:MAG: hypothetical protein A2392_00360 [Candidatus Kaiserbacteria bacterium RIFOXYB1_FULL_46_14]